MKFSLDAALKYADYGSMDTNHDIGIKLYDDLPLLTAAEARRRWLDVSDLLIVSGLGGSGYCDKIFLDQINNWATRGLITFEKPGKNRNSPRLYSMATALKVRTMIEITNLDIALAPAVLAGDRVASAMLYRLQNGLNISFDEEESRFLELSRNYRGEWTVKDTTRDDINRYLGEFARILVEYGYFTKLLIEAYVNIWSLDLHRRGLHSCDPVASTNKI